MREGRLDMDRQDRQNQVEREQRVVREPTSPDSLLSLNDNQKAKLIQVTVKPALSVCQL